MSEIIYVDDGIEYLVRTLNQIKGVRTSSSCIGHSAGEAAGVGFICTYDVVVSLMKALMRELTEHEGITLEVHSARKNKIMGDKKLLPCTLLVGGKKNKKAKAKLLANLVEDLRKSGLLTKECDFEIVKRKYEPGKVDVTGFFPRWEPDFEQSKTLITDEKFALLKTFVWEKWHERVESFKTQTWRIGNYFHTYVMNLPNLSGTPKEGKFYFERDRLNIWDIRWQERLISMLLRLPGDVYYVTCLEDIASTSFEDDAIIRAILEP
jgi:hypothetical protein